MSTECFDSSLTRYTSSSTPLTEDESYRLTIETLSVDIFTRLFISLFELGSLNPPCFGNSFTLVMFLEGYG